MRGWRRRRVWIVGLGVMMMIWEDVSFSFPQFFLSVLLLFGTELTVLDGFFDAGMLLQALQARTGSLENTVLAAAEKATPRRREVGKKLRLSEY